MTYKYRVRPLPMKIVGRYATGGGGGGGGAGGIVASYTPPGGGGVAGGGGGGSTSSNPVEKIDFEALEKLLNEQGQEEFEIVHMSVSERIVFFQKNVYEERRSPEHIDRVLKAVTSYGDVKDLEFILDVRANDSDIPDPTIYSDDEAWRFLIDRILGES